MTAVSVSMRSAQATASLPEVNQLATGTMQRLLVVAERDHEEGDPGEQRGDAEQAGGHEFGSARRRSAAEQAGDQEAEQRQEDDQIVYMARSQPFIALMSSTAIEPRLR